MAPENDSELSKLSVPELREMVTALSEMAKRANLPLPGVADTAPQVNLNWDLRAIAVELGNICKDKPIFRAESEVVTINEDAGRTEVMDADRFRTWILDYCVTWKKWDKDRGVGQPDTLGVEAARGVLKSGQFRSRVRELRGINTVRQPVRREDGKVELLPIGYDGPSGIYTLNTCDYAEDMDPDEAVCYLRKLFAAFPWADDGRSLAVHMAAFFTVYGQGLLPPGTITPLFLYNANEPGSGKTLLVKIILTMIYGRAGATSIGENEEELRKRLDAAAQHLQPFLFFDDEAGFLKNQLLNGWLTANFWEGRVLGTSKWFYMPKRAVTFICGNGVTLSDDLGRRHLLADLFSVERVKERTLPEGTEVITDTWLKDQENRKKVLAALWAVVKFSYAKGLPHRKPGRPVAGFETWSSVIPRIVMDGAWEDPLRPHEAPDAGGRGSQDLEKLIKLVIAEKMWDHSKGEAVPLVVAKVELGEMVPIARRAGLFLEVLDTTEMIMLELDKGGKRAWKEEVYVNELGIEERRIPATPEEKRGQAERWYDRAMANSLRARFKGRLGQIFRGEDGLAYQIGERTSSRVSTFLIHRL